MTRTIARKSLKFNLTQQYLKMNKNSPKCSLTLLNRFTELRSFKLLLVKFAYFCAFSAPLKKLAHFYHSILRSIDNMVTKKIIIFANIAEFIITFFSVQKSVHL